MADPVTDMVKTLVGVALEAAEAATPPGPPTIGGGFTRAAAFITSIATMLADPDTPEILGAEPTEALTEIVGRLADIMGISV